MMIALLMPSHVILTVTFQVRHYFTISQRHLQLILPTSHSRDPKKMPGTQEALSKCSWDEWRMMLQELKHPTYDNVSSDLSPSTIHVLRIKCAIFFVKDLLEGKSWVQNTVTTILWFLFKLYKLPFTKIQSRPTIVLRKCKPCPPTAICSYYLDGIPHLKYLHIPDKTILKGQMDEREGNKNAKNLTT